MSFILPEEFPVTRRSAPATAALACATLAFSLAATGASPASAGSLEVQAGLGQSVIQAKTSRTVHLRINLKALVVANETRRAPVNIALVLDKSGSMRGERIEGAKHAARLALERLSPDDRVAVVAFNHTVDVLMPSQTLRDQGDVRRRIDGMVADGTTAIFAGVSEGARQVAERLDRRRVNRVILMSDGQANVGPASPRELGELGRTLAGKGITVTTIGFGLEYNEDLMERLATASDGNHAFARTSADLVKFFNLEFGDAQSVAVQDIDIRIDIQPGFKPKRVLSRDAEIKGQAVELKLAALQADNERYVVVELEASDALPEGTVTVAETTVGYTDLATGNRGQTRATADVRISASAEEAAASIDKTATAQIATQIALEESRRAVELRDAGQIEEARQALSGSAAAAAAVGMMLMHVAPAAPAASTSATRDLEAAAARAKAAEKNLDGEAWDANRKEMRAYQRSIGGQNKY
jgi:Ca-activated chloride channel family protein